MWRYFASRLAQIPFILIVVTMTIFIVVRSTPGDPVQIMLGMETSPDAVAAIRKEFRLDRPVAMQYVLWLGDLAQGIKSFKEGLKDPEPRAIADKHETVEAKKAEEVKPG